jgi:hypothetical protein
VKTIVGRVPSARLTNGVLASVVSAGAVLAGALCAAEPKLAVGLAAVGAMALLAFRHRVASFGLLLFLTIVVPYGVQNRLGVGGGAGAPGLLLSDLLLISGIGSALVTLAYQRLDRRRFAYATGIVLFLGFAALQFLHGLEAGGDRSRAGQEFRVALGFGSFLIALPLLSDARTRRQLLRTLLVLSILLGAWGLLQWFGHLTLGAAGDSGVRAGVRLTSSGTGQLQGGEYGFPVVIIGCSAVLIFGAVRSALARAWVGLAIALNAAACLVTFERTFWLDVILGICVVMLFAPAVQRVKMLLAAPIIVVVAIGALAIAAPSELITAHQRLTSISQYASDDSVRYRLTESRIVLERIRAHPVTGSGFAATIFWGQAWAQVPAKSYTFAHNGYLWLAWKVGIPVAALLVALFVSALVLRPPPGDDLLARAVRRGAQGAIAGLLLTTLTFPSFSALSITPAMGVLLALAVSPAPGSRRAALRLS